MIDAHTHLDMVEAAGIAEPVAAARDAGLTRVLTVGTDPDGCRAAVAAAEADPEVFAAVGHHPNAAGSFDEDALALLRELAGHPRVRAVGETGLDYYRDRAPRSAQAEAFAAQIALARETALPLVIHTRDAEEDTLATLARDADGVEVVLHCFSMPDHLGECVARGWWISFAGNVTYPSATALADVAGRVPLERLLVETDAPYLTPQPRRRERNQPAFVVHTARFLAARRGMAYEELDAALEANAARLFGW